MCVNTRKVTSEVWFHTSWLGKVTSTATYAVYDPKHTTVELEHFSPEWSLLMQQMGDKSRIPVGDIKKLEHFKANLT